MRHFFCSKFVTKNKNLNLKTNYMSCHDIQQRSPINIIEGPHWETGNFPQAIKILNTYF